MFSLLIGMGCDCCGRKMRTCKAVVNGQTIEAMYDTDEYERLVIECHVDSRGDPVLTSQGTTRRAFVCKYCGQVFASKSRLQNHRVGDCPKDLDSHGNIRKRGIYPVLENGGCDEVQKIKDRQRKNNKRGSGSGRGQEEARRSL